MQFGAALSALCLFLCWFLYSHCSTACDPLPFPARPLTYFPSPSPPQTLSVLNAATRVSRSLEWLLFTTLDMEGSAEATSVTRRGDVIVTQGSLGPIDKVTAGDSRGRAGQPLPPLSEPVTITRCAKSRKNAPCLTSSPAQSTLGMCHRARQAKSMARVCDYKGLYNYWPPNPFLPTAPPAWPIVAPNLPNSATHLPDQ